jgi:hypothetical protein
MANPEWNRLRPGGNDSPGDDQKEWVTGVAKKKKARIHEKRKPEHKGKRA